MKESPTVSANAVRMAVWLTTTLGEHFVNIALFKKTYEDSGCSNVTLGLEESSKEARRLTPESFIFFDETLHYLVTMISASMGKWVSIGGTLQEGPLNVRLIGRALNEDIFFPGLPLLWANTLGYPVAELQIDIRPVPPNEKVSQSSHVKMRDVGSKADTVFFLQAFEKARERIEEKFGNGWFNKWPEVFRFGYLIRNALAHDGRWGIQDQKGRE